MNSITATYSPEDNKLRLYPALRLDAETYSRVRAAGFIWAPKQELFVAPAWSPYREDLARELCGEIGDEDTSLVERAEAKAERLEDLSERKQQQADAAHKAVHAIADGIPLGQPILVGHHSERHARKDAERIENGMRKAVECWKAAGYWQERAAGALRHAKYKELPAVRYRRIKGLEADKRKQEKYKSDADMWLKLWTECAKEQDKELQMKVAIRISGMGGRLLMPRKEGDRPDFDQRPDAYSVLTNSYPSLYAPRTIDEVLAVALDPSTYPASIAHCERWIEHYSNRIAYERAMLDEQGGLKGEQFDYQIGGRILRRGEWLPILKVNKRGGVIMSVTVSGHFASTVSVDEIRDYRPPAEGEAEKVKAATDKGPMCNYPGEGFKHMTTDEWKRKKMSDVPQSIVHQATATHGKHRTRATYGGHWSTVAVYLTDAKRVDPPAPPQIPAEPVRFECIREFNQDVQFTRATAAEVAEALSPENFDTKMKALEQQLKAGVQVVAAPQLFPTPADLAARVTEEAAIEPGHDVLEPSAGTGAILDACFHLNGIGFNGTPEDGRLVAVEISRPLADALAQRYPLASIIPGDFLEQNGNLGKFDRVVMNPPFQNGADIKHIQHALKFLKPGGRLVAICANGSRQQAILKPLAENSGGSWEDLPAGTFASQGTNVNSALLVIQG